MARKLIIISDLHVGAGALDDCDEELERELIRFLQYVNRQLEPVELIINGDFFDFAQAAPWSGNDLESSTVDGIPLCFSLAQSLAKLDAICKAHQRLLDALTELAKSEKHQIVVMPGNHDVDFFWPEVREAFLAKISANGETTGLRFHLERHYRPTEYGHVWIEHGNQFDPVNDFYVSPSGKPEDRRLLWGPDAPPILSDVTGERRLVECLGTRFLIRVINRLDEEYPYIDNVKPFSRMFRILRDSALDPAGGSRKFGFAYWHISQFIEDRLQTPEGRSDLLSKPKEVATADSWISIVTASMSKRKKLDFTRHLIECGLELSNTLDVELQSAQVSERVMQTIANHPDKLLPLLEADVDEERLALAKGTLPIVGFDETKALRRAAQELQSDDIRLVVFGHTHERIRESGYINSGSWTRYWTDAKRVPRWSDLKVDAGANFPYELNFVEVTVDKPDGLLVTFHAVETPFRSAR